MNPAIFLIFFVYCFWPHEDPRVVINLEKKNLKIVSPENTSLCKKFFFFKLLTFLGSSVEPHTKRPITERPITKHSITERPFH